MGTHPVLQYLESLAPLAPAGVGSIGTFGTFATEIAGSGAAVGSLAAKTTDKGYRALVANINSTSYSILEQLHTCPRAFALDKIKANSEMNAGVPEPLNIDFVYGHAVGAGAQGLLATNNDLTAGLFAATVGWKAHFEFGTEPQFSKSNKSFFSAQIAVEKFHRLMQEHPELQQYEVLMVTDSHGAVKPAIELSFALDTGDGYKYYGHIDAIVRNKYTGRVSVFELKTTGMKTLHPALYANSNQALGYAVALDQLAPGFADYEVIYCSYQTSLEEWTVLPFAKSRAKKAEWLQDLLLDHARISSYRQLAHYPKNGSNCLKFNRPCKWFGECDLVNRNSFASLPVLPPGSHAEVVDFEFTIDDVLAANSSTDQRG